MSGVEAAGLVVDAVPIIISVLERVQRLGPKSSEGRRDYQRLRLELDFNLLLFRRTLEVLLKDTLESSELDDLLSNPTSSQWQSPTVEDALRTGLGPAYPAFLDLTVKNFETVSSIEKSLQKITNGSKVITIALRKASSANSISNQLERLRKLNSDIEYLANSFVNLRQLQAIENLGASLVRFREFQDVAQSAESRADDELDRLGIEIDAGAGVSASPTASFESPEYDRVETGSSYTVDSEVGQVLASMMRQLTPEFEDQLRHL